MLMQHDGHTAWAFKHEQAARTRSTGMQHGHGAWTCSKDMHLAHVAWTWSMDMDHRQAAWTRSKIMQHEEMYMQHGDMDMLQIHGHCCIQKIASDIKLLAPMRTSLPSPLPYEQSTHPFPMR